MRRTLNVIIRDCIDRGVGNADGRKWTIPALSIETTLSESIIKKWLQNSDQPTPRKDSFDKLLSAFHREMQSEWERELLVELQNTWTESSGQSHLIQPAQQLERNFGNTFLVKRGKTEANSHDYRTNLENSDKGVEAPYQLESNAHDRMRFSRASNLIVAVAAIFLVLSVSTIFLGKFLTADLISKEVSALNAIGMELDEKRSSSGFSNTQNHTCFEGFEPVRAFQLKVGAKRSFDQNVNRPVVFSIQVTLENPSANSVTITSFRVLNASTAQRANESKMEDDVKRLINGAELKIKLPPNVVFPREKISSLENLGLNAITHLIRDMGEDESKPLLFGPSAVSPVQFFVELPNSIDCTEILITLMQGNQELVRIPFSVNYSYMDELETTPQLREQDRIEKILNGE